MSDETYNDLIQVIPYKQIEELEKLTGFDEEELLTDFVLYLSTGELPFNIDSWNEYYNDTLHFY